MHFPTPLLFLTCASLTLASPFRRDDASDIEVTCNDPFLGLFVGAFSIIGSLIGGPEIVWGEDAQAALLDLVDHGVGNVTNSLGSQHTYSRTVGDFTAYVWNDGPCDVPVSKLDFDEILKPQAEKCKNAKGERLIGFGRKRQNNKDQWKEIGVVKKDTFGIWVAPQDVSKKSKQWGQSPDSCQ